MQIQENVQWFEAQECDRLDRRCPVSTIIEH